MNEHPLAAVGEASATLQQAVEHAELWRVRRNHAISAVKAHGASVAYLMDAARLSRASIYAILKQSDAKQKVQGGREEADKLLAATVKAVDKADAAVVLARRARDEKLMSACDAGIEITAIAKAAGLNRTQLYAIFHHYSA